MHKFIALTVLSSLRGLEFSSPTRVAGRNDYDYSRAANISHMYYSPEDILKINFDDKDKKIIDLIDNANPLNVEDILTELRTFANLLLCCNHYYSEKDDNIINFSVKYVKKGGPKFIRKRIDFNFDIDKNDWNFYDEQNIRSLMTESKVFYAKLKVKVFNHESPTYQKHNTSHTPPVHGNQRIISIQEYL